MALTETYVDPAIAANSGTGSIGDPYGDLQYALDTMTRDATNGDRLNIKEGTDEILTAPIDLTVYGVPTVNAPIVFQGYTAAADDGGMGGIDADANSAVFNSATLDYVHFVDLNLHNSGVGDYIVRLDDFCSVVNCNFFDGGSVPLLWINRWSSVDGCSFENGSNVALYLNGTASLAFNNTIRNGPADFTKGIYVHSSGTTVGSNTLILSGSTLGIHLNQSYMSAKNNSIFSVSGTGSGIVVSFGQATVINNIIEGFSGVGGLAISASPTKHLLLYGSNKFYNNTANDPGATSIIKDAGNNDVLAESAFIDAANDDFRVKSSVKAGAYPTENFPDLSVRTYLDIGALQSKSFPLVHPAMTGGIRG